MNFSAFRFLTLLAIAAPLTLSAAPTLSQTEPEKVKFFCSQTLDSSSGEKIPATIAWVPERQGHIRIIGWKSQYFSQDQEWTPQKRCQMVTQKFQKSYEQGSLNYLTNGEVNNQQVICAVATQGEVCNSNNQLFTIKQHDHPDLVIARLIGIFQGYTSDWMYQGSGQQIYVPLNDYLSKAPTIEQASRSK